jgi:DNA-binding MltR family transcriptional regulator
VAATARGVRFLTKRRLTAAETSNTLARFRLMDDRTCAIILGAMLDNSLERLLLLHMEPLSKDERERLLYGGGPLSSFSAKIQIAFAFGLIGPKAKHDLDIFGEIRNVFGHAAHGVTFRNHSIKKRLTVLHAHPVFDMVMRTFKRDPIRKYDTTRGRFLLAAASFVKMIDAACENKHPKKLKRAIHFLDG